MSHLIIRAITAAALSIFIWRASLVWSNAPSVTLALLVAGEILTVGIYLFARQATAVSYRPIALVSTLCATFFFLLVVLDSGLALAPPALTVSLQIFGILWQIWSKLTLGRSFGLLPAHRKLVTSGPYSVVRHPIYLGYFLNHLGFLLASFNIENLLLISALYFFQILRIREEEQILMDKAPGYAEYMSKTRFRLIPGVF